MVSSSTWRSESMKSRIVSTSIIAGVFVTLTGSVPRPIAAQHVNLGGVGYERGDPNAPVQVIEFGDFGCSACGQFARETFGVIHEEFVATGKVHWRYVPFIAGLPNG